MADTTGILIALGALAILALLIYLGLRFLFASIRNVKDAVDSEFARRRMAQPRRRQDEEAAAPKERSGTHPARSRPETPESPASSKRTAAAADPAAAMAEYYREQARKSDDADKARIRAHVERPVPPITPEGREAIELAGRAWIAIRHVFPPRLPQRSMSYFGGLPIVPPGEFDWPMIHNREGLLERLNFMAQVDCRDLPPGPARHLFPDMGYIYFFAPMSLSFGEEAMHFVARYEPGPATREWTPLDVGSIGEIESGDRMDAVWRGKRTRYDKVEVAFGWIEEPTEEEVAARGDEGYPFEVAEKIRAGKLDAFFGPPVPYDPMLSASSAPKDMLWMPYEGFPANWKTARILRRFVEAYHREETADVAKRLGAPGEVAVDDPEVLRLRTLQDALTDFGRRISNAFSATLDARATDHAAVPDAVKQQIIAFLEHLRVNGMPSSKERSYIHLRLPRVIGRWQEIAAIHGAEGALADAEGAALIGPDVVEALAHRHAARKHQMLGQGEVVQVAADDMKDGYLLLLQLGPDEALDWLVGEMGPLQYWIAPEDLAARRFENTVLTIEAY